MVSLLKESGLGLDTDIATNLLAGIEEASGNFTNPEVTAETFEKVAQLLRAGGQRRPKVKERIISPGAIPAKAPEEEKRRETPKEWLEPKVYKGTSIS